MPNKLFSLSHVVLFALLFSFGADSLKAQCTGRYLDTTTFSSIDSFTNVVYTTTAGGTAGDTLLLDVYQPSADTACLRHLIIWVHGGAFYKGSKNDGDMTLLCRRFAQRGYVAASINYRLAPSLIDLYDSTQIFKFAMDASSDLKAAIGFFYQDAYQSNQWKIDTTAIFIGGSSAGGIAADFVATLDSLDQLAAVFQPVAISTGGIAGNSGNSGHSNTVVGVASLAGAVNTNDWIRPGDPPIVMCQGTADGTIPYECGQALQQYTYGLIPTIIDFCGSGAMAPALASAGVDYSLLPFPGSGHVPWDTNATIMNRTDSAVTAFFYHINCTQAIGHCSVSTGITDITTPSVNIYPNPATDKIQIETLGHDLLASVTLYDYTGRAVSQIPASGHSVSLSVKGFSSGIYVLHVLLSDQNTPPITRKITIE
jgi:acetyl esterase/lipase